MKNFLIIPLFLFLCILLIYFMRLLMEAIVNLWCAIRHKKTPPLHEGMVYNKKTKKLEADNSQILPY